MTDESVTVLYILWMNPYRHGVDLQVDGLDLAELAEVLRELLLARLPAQASHE